LVAEICSRYFPNDIHMHSFQNCSNTSQKVDNWRQLKDFFALKELKVRSDILEGTIKGLHGSAVQLVEHLYELFTGKRVQQMPEIETKESNEGSTFNMNRRRNKPADPAVSIPGLTAGSRQLTRNLPAPPTVQFGAVRLTHLENMSAARSRMGMGNQ